VLVLTDTFLENPVVAESLLDRLINAGHQMIMNGPSYRPIKRPRNPTDKPAEQRLPDNNWGQAMWTNSLSGCPS
jgi:hypothetical protein